MSEPGLLTGHAPHPADVTDGRGAGELAIVVRSGVVESRHLGHAVLVDPDGQVVVAVGDADTIVFPRSSLKPWQAASIRRAGACHDGAPLDGEVLALTAGSHAATPRHVTLALAMLTGAGLDADALQCPAALPGDDDARARVLRDGGAATRIAYNCSGKHAGMLLACVANDWPPDSYLDPTHPLQVRIREDLEAAVGAPVAATGVDGCGAPQHAVGLLALARAATRFVRGDEHERAVATSMRAHPWAVAGPGREDTLAMERLDGVIAKTGADGVQLLGTRDGWAVLVKVLDGSHRAAMPAALALLSRVPGVDTSAAVEATREPVLGGERRVGAILPGADVTDA